MPYPTIRAGMKLTASVLQAMQPVTVTKTADQSVTSSTTNVNDNHLFVALSANAVYHVTGMLFYSARTDTDIKIGWTGPTGSTFYWIAHGQIQDGTGGVSAGMVVDRQSIGATAFPLGGFGAENTTYMTAPLWGVVTTSSTAGNLQFNWAQRVSNGTASIVRAGSFIDLIRVS